MGIDLMQCINCGSLRMMEFIDGFGKRRVFCKVCERSFLDTREFDGLKIPKDFKQNVHFNPRASIRHRW